MFAKTMKGMIYMCITAVLSSLFAWFVGLLIDANLDMGSHMGFLELRIVFPILVMGAFILKALDKK